MPLSAARKELSLKEQIEELRAVDLERVTPECDFSWPFESYQSEVSHESSQLFEWRSDEGILRGFVLSRIGFDGECEIMHLACRERGAGEAMMRAWFSWAKDCGFKKVFLEFHHRNTSAQNLYQRLGFEIIAHRPRYYRDGGDAVLMSLSLPLKF